MKELETLFSTELSDLAMELYYKRLSSWGITDAMLPDVIDEVLKKAHKFPALAAFWAAKIEADEWR